MKNDNLLLVEKIRKDPLTSNWINHCCSTYLEKVVIDESLKGLGSIEDLGMPSETWKFACAAPFNLIPNQRFLIRINLINHQTSFSYLGEYENNLELFVGSTIVHEVAHLKYHLWSWLDEMKTGELGYSEELINKETKRFTLENQEFVVNIKRKLIPAHEYTKPLTF